MEHPNFALTQSRRAFFGLVLIFFQVGIAWRGGRLLIALGALDQQASQFTIGILAATSVVLPLLLSVYAGRTSDRLGARWPIVWGALTMTAALALPILGTGLAMLIGCALILGLGQIFVQVTVQNAVGSVSPPAVRSRNFATLQVGASISLFVGPLIIGVTVDHLGLEWGFAFVAVVAALIAVPAILFAGSIRGRGSGKAKDAEERILDLLKHERLRLPIFMSGVAVCGIELFAFYIPVYGKSIGLSATMIGAAIAVHAIAMLVVRLGMGVLLRIGSEVGIATTALFIAALGFAVIPVFDSVPVLFIASFMLGVGLGVSAPLTQSLTYSSAPEGRSGEALGLRVLVNKLMQIVVPLTFGSIGTAFGVASVFFGNAGILLLGATAATLNKIRQRRSGETG